MTAAQRNLLLFDEREAGGVKGARKRYSKEELIRMVEKAKEGKKNDAEHL